jgi:predicted ATPase/DNA-binding CsgD family transcriptional regulator
MDNHNLTGGVMCSEELTWRELEVLALLSDRLTNREIAQKLHLAESTVKDYVGNILSKLYVKNRREAVKRALALGLLEPERAPVSRPMTNFPADVTPFIGRRVELAEISRLLQETRMLTLAGPGGIGKTRLAIKASGETAGNFKDGCCFVSLVPIHTSEHLVQRTAEALKFPLAVHENPQALLLRFLRRKNLLMVMDNFEHLLDGAGIISEILGAAPDVKILATSRERLNLKSETVFTVGGLDISHLETTLEYRGSDAVTLFLQSAGKVVPGFEPGKDELDGILEICKVVEGMPLAIELAAAWLQVLSIAEIKAELKKGIDILAGDLRDAPSRHRSIRAVFDHSWSLLDRAEQKTLMRLSVFRGGFTREAAQQVSGANLQQLMGLTSKSLLSRNPTASRLEIHELLRQYAREKLEESDIAAESVIETHAAYFADFIQQRWEDLKSSRQMKAIAEVETDIENVRAAWRYCLDRGNNDLTWKFIFGLWMVYWIRSWNLAGMDLFAQAYRKLTGDDRDVLYLRALTKALQAYFMAWLGLHEQGYEYARESVGILEESNKATAQVLAHWSFNVNAFFCFRYSEMDTMTESMARISSESGDRWLITYSSWVQSLVSILRKEFENAEQIAKKTLRLTEEVEDQIGSTLLLITLGHVAFVRDQLDHARDYYKRCLDIAERTGFFYSAQTSSKYLAKVTLSLGDLKGADFYILHCLSLTNEIPFVRDLVNMLYEYARLQAKRNNFKLAVELLGLVLEHPASYQSRMLEGPIRDSALDLLAELEGVIPRHIYTDALNRGKTLVLDDVVTDLLNTSS